MGQRCNQLFKRVMRPTIAHKKIFEKFYNGSPRDRSLSVSNLNQTEVTFKTSRVTNEL